MLQEAPRSAQSKTDTEEPMRDIPNKDNDEPKRAQLRRDKALPRLKKSKTAKEAPRLLLPKTESEDPMREQLRTANELPK
jgi:hypothetical protein